MPKPYFFFILICKILTPKTWSLNTFPEKISISQTDQWHSVKSLNKPGAITYLSSLQNSFIKCTETSGFCYYWAMINPYIIQCFLASLSLPHWSNLKVMCLANKWAFFLVITYFLNLPDCAINILPIYFTIILTFYLISLNSPG